MAFSNNFFSIAGQKERLSNVKNVFATLIPGSKDKIVANVSNPVGKAALEGLANHPFTSAAILTVPFAAGARTAIVSSVAKSSLKTKVALSAGALIAGPAILKSPKTQTKLIQGITSTPDSFANIGMNLGKFVEDPSIQSAKTIFTENPVVAGIIGGAGLLGAGKVGLAAAGILATKENTRAIREQDFTPNVPDIGNAQSNGLIPSEASLPIGTAQPLSAGTSNPLKQADVGEEPRRGVSRKRKPSKPPIMLRNEINIGKYIKERHYYAC